MITVDQMARQFQADNLFARKVYLVGMAVFVVASIVLMFIDDWGVATLTLALVGFFLGLSVYNERMIRRFRKAGF